MPDDKKEKSSLIELKIGYRAKRPEERKGPDDRGLVPLDPEVQLDFERTIFAWIEDETRTHLKRLIK